jgi:demethylmenaquinone methyltransferase/2-methoxy-6-polyprenyl-1,4-benzoquinol methylase
MSEVHTPLDVPLTREQIQQFYSMVAPAYDGQTARFEAEPKALAVGKLARKPGERLLEVAVGTGGGMLEVMRASGAEGVVGIDVAPGMLAFTRKRLAEAGIGPVPLLLADARHLPFKAATFDCLFNSYMLDLIPNADTSKVLAEFRRVLKPGGRIVLANLTEGEGEDAAFSEGWKERFQANPLQVGGCRPVLTRPFLESEGFVDIVREYRGGQSWPTEVVTAKAPPHAVTRRV